MEVMRVTTRAEGRREQQEDEAELAELAACGPEVTPLSGGRRVSNDPEAEVKPVAAGGREEAEEEEAEEAEVELPRGRLGEANESPELDIPVLGKGKGDRETLVVETRNDPSLKNWRALAEKGEGGFVWEKGLLHQEVMTQVLEKGLVLVLPKSFRHRVLEVAHDKMQHMGPRRVTRM